MLKILHHLNLDHAYFSKSFIFKRKRDDDLKPKMPTVLNDFNMTDFPEKYTLNSKKRFMLNKKRERMKYQLELIKYKQQKLKEKEETYKEKMIELAKEDDEEIKVEQLKETLLKVQSKHEEEKESML